MADREQNDNPGAQPAEGETRERERERVRSSNDRDQEREREGDATRHTRGYDEAVQGAAAPTDPDSAASEVERDETPDEP